MGWQWRKGKRVYVTAVVIDRPALEEAVRNLGVRETARRVGCAAPTVSNLVTGSRESCEVHLADRFAEVLKIPRDDLFTIRSVSQATRGVAIEDTPGQKSA